MRCIKRKRTRKQLMEEEGRRINERWLMKAGRAGRKRWGGGNGGGNGGGGAKERKHELQPFRARGALQGNLTLATQ